MERSPDTRSSWAVGWGWASQVTSIALEMVLPGILGLWVDRQLGSVMVFLVLGVAFGVTGGMIHLVRFSRSIGQSPPHPGTSRPEDSAPS